MTENAVSEVSVRNVSEGDTGPVTTTDRLTREDFVQYAGASGDFNPIHYDEPYAIRAGNSQVFGQGMLTTGIASTMLTDWFGIESLRCFKVRFTDRVWPGDTLTIRGTVTETNDSGPAPSALIEFEVTRQDGDVVLLDEATMSEGLKQMGERNLMKIVGYSTTTTGYLPYTRE